MREATVFATSSARRPISFGGKRDRCCPSFLTSSFLISVIFHFLILNIQIGKLNVKWNLENGKYYLFSIDFSTSFKLPCVFALIILLNPNFLASFILLSIDGTFLSSPKRPT